MSKTEKSRYNAAMKLIQKNQRKALRQDSVATGSWMVDDKQYILHGNGFYFLELTNHIEGLPAPPSAPPSLKVITDSRQELDGYAEYYLTAEGIKERQLGNSRVSMFPTADGEKWHVSATLLRESLRILGGRCRTLYVPPARNGIGVVEGSNGRIYICPIMWSKWGEFDETI